MRTWTKQEFQDKILMEHDLQEESFISPAEMTNYINEGIDWAESIVIGLYEDYYLDRTDWIDLANEVDLPTFIYANKLRKVEVAVNENDHYPLQLFKNTRLENNKTGYNIFHRSGETPKLVFENVDNGYNYYRLTFTRNANRVVEASDIIDLPECAVYFAQQYVKRRCYQKERDPMAFQSSEEIGVMSQQLTDTLSNIVNDGSDQLEADFSFYVDFDSDYTYN
jgi:hypothetical protein